MSLLHSSDPNIIVIPDIVKKPPANPLLRSEVVDKTPAPSVKATSSVFSYSQSVLENRVLFNDQRCFLTGEVSSEIQACHLINTIRTKQESAKIILKEQVVRRPSNIMKQRLANIITGVHTHPAGLQWPEGFLSRQLAQLSALLSAFSLVRSSFNGNMQLMYIGMATLKSVAPFVSLYPWSNSSLCRPIS
jgi:hypothetical protein